MAKKIRAVMVEGNIKTTLVKLTVPMIAGIFGIIVFNLADTFFVSRLGTNELAALSYTFPVVTILNSIALGMGIGSSSVISRAIGRGDEHRIKRLATDSLLLGFLVVFIVMIIGQLTIKPIFTLLGANDDVLPIITTYMRIWYFGVIFVVIPMVGNSVIRALGDTRTPSIIMIIAAVMNTTLDPLLIFGIGFFPRLGVAGAALATVFSRMVTFSAALYVLGIREKMLIYDFKAVKEIIHSWKEILYIGLPNAFTKMLTPLTIGVITSLMSLYGAKAVAGFGVATKLEMFAFMVVHALSTVMTPFVGQNIGSKKIGRVKEGISLSQKFSMIYGVIVYIILFLTAEFIAGIFNKDPEVTRVIIMYLRIVPSIYGFQGILHLTVASLNAMNKPIHSASLTIFQMFVLYVPMAYLGSKLLGYVGIFGAIVISYTISGITSYVVLKKNVVILDNTN